jgi:hypothetical protein
MEDVCVEESTVLIPCECSYLHFDDNVEMMVCMPLSIQKTSDAAISLCLRPGAWTCSFVEKSRYIPRGSRH